MDNRGFLRTLEAVLAVVIVFLFIYYAGRGSGDGDDRYVQGVKSLQESILDEITKNDDFRECIVTTDIDKFNALAEEKVSNCINEEFDKDKCSKKIDCFIDGSLPLRYKEEYAFTICSPTDPGSCS